MQQTLEEIRREGLDALRERLGRAGMIRFLAQLGSGEGDYAKARHAWVDALSLEELRGLSQSKKPQPKRREKKSPRQKEKAK
jgi:hypothetical protein